MKNILAITGKPGLFKLVSRGNNMLIVESLLDGKRMPTYARDKIVSLADVSMFTTGDDIALSEVLTKVGEKKGSSLPPSMRRRRTTPPCVHGSQRCCPTGTKTASIRATYANSSSGTTSSSTQESPISASRKSPQRKKKWKQKTNCSFKR